MSLRESGFTTFPDINTRDYGVGGEQVSNSHKASVITLDEHIIHKDTPINHIGFQDGIIEVNHGVPISESGEALTTTEEKVLLLGSIGLDTNTTAKVLDETSIAVRTYRKSVYDKMRAESNISRATVAAFNTGVLAVKQSIANPRILTRREAQMITRIGRGETNEEINENLGVSLGLVRKNLMTMSSNLGVNSRTGLLTYGIVSGQVDPKSIALPLPPHITITKSEPSAETSGGLRLTEATFKDGAISLDPEAVTPFDYAGRPATEDNNVLSTQQDNVLLLVAMGLTNAKIAAALSTTQKNVGMQRSRIATKFGTGPQAAQLIVAGLRYGHLKVEQNITHSVVALDPVELALVSDSVRNRSVAETAARMGQTQPKITSYLRHNVRPNIPHDRQMVRTSLLIYGVLTGQYNPFTRKTNPIY